MRLRVSGSSMAPRIKHGDIIAVDPARRHPQSGDVVFCTVDGKPMIRRYRCGGTLEADNPAFPPRTIAGARFELIGTVAEIVHRRRV